MSHSHIESDRGSSAAVVAGLVIVGVLVLLLVAFLLGWIGPRGATSVTPNIVPGTGGAGAPSSPGGAGGAGTSGGAAPRSMLPTHLVPGYVLV